MPLMPPSPSCLILSIACLGGLAFTASGAERVLVDHGSSRYEIVCAADASPSTLLAARELQSWVKASTGVELPQATTPDEQRAHLFVGPNPWSERAGITPAGLKAEGYQLRTIGDDLHLVGVDEMRGSLMPKRTSATQTGSLSAVYDFLERTLGILFLWHDSLGTIVPPHDRVVVEDMVVESAPAWTYRHLAYGPEGQLENTLFGRRLRLGHAYTVTHSHAWYSIAPIEKYGQAHPEWYAELNGRRQPAYYMEHHGGQVCTTNPDVIELFAKAAINFFNQQPQRDMFSISPNDGGGFCTCKACLALDPGTRADGKPLMSDRLITFYNAIAERLATVHPTKLLGAYAYSFYREPPQKVQPHPNLYLVHATNTAFHQGQGWPEEHAMEKQWRKGAKHLAKYDIYYSPDSSLNLIAPVTRHLVEKVRAESAAGLEGAYLYMGQSYEQLGAGHFLLARLLWDPKADATALAKRYYQALYGPASKPVQAYYDLLESRLNRSRQQPLDTSQPAIRSALRTRPGAGSPAYLLSAYEPILEEASRLIDTARSCTLSDDETARLQRLIDQHELLTTTVRGMYLAARIELDATTTREDAATFLKLVEQRQAVRRRLQAWAPTQCKNLDLGDSAETLALAPGGALCQLARVLTLPADSKRSPRPFPLGDFEQLPPEKTAAALRWSATGNASLELVKDQVCTGKQSLRVVIPEGSTGSLTFATLAQELTACRLTYAHWNAPNAMPQDAGDEADAVTRGEQPLAPRTRVICRDSKGKAIGKNQWSGVGAHDVVRQWHAQPQLVKTPAGTRQISFTLFFQFPGTYMLDDVRIEELGAAP